jgi:WD40 repeat protein
MNARHILGVAVVLLCSSFLAAPGYCTTVVSRSSLTFADPVTAVAFSRDNWLIACSSAKFIHIIDAVTGKGRHRFKLRGVASALAFSRHNSLLFVHYSDVKLGTDFVDSRTGKVLARVIPPDLTYGGEGVFVSPGRSIVVSPDGSLLAISDPDSGGDTLLIEIKTHKILKELLGASPTFSSDGKTLFTAAGWTGGDVEADAASKAIWIWRTQPLKLSRTILMPSDDVEALGLTHNNRTLLSLTHIFKKVVYGKGKSDFEFEEVDNEITFRDAKSGRIQKDSL